MTKVAQNNKELYEIDNKMDLKEYVKKAKKDPKFKKEYEKFDLAFEIGEMVYEARLQKELTQEKLAELVGTKQPGIARLENGRQLPSLTFLQKIAKALDRELLPPRFSHRDEPKSKEAAAL